jgi:hypothetical protein
LGGHDTWIGERIESSSSKLFKDRAQKFRALAESDPQRADAAFPSSDPNASDLNASRMALVAPDSPAGVAVAFDLRRPAEYVAQGGRRAVDNIGQSDDVAN